MVLDSFPGYVPNQCSSFVQPVIKFLHERHSHDAMQGIGAYHFKGELGVAEHPVCES